MPDEYKFVAAFADSCPEECFSPHEHERHRWHTLSVVMGNHLRQADILAGMRKRAPNFTFRKWVMGRRPKRDGSDYRSIIRRHLLPVLADNRSTSTAWSFRESTVHFCLPFLLRDFRISPLQYVRFIDRKGRARATFVDVRHYPEKLTKRPLLEREVLAILVIVDGIASSYRQFDEGMKRHHPRELDRVWQIFSDYLSGDSKSDNRRGELLYWLADIRFPGRTTFHYAEDAEFRQGDLITDNLAGMMNEIANDPDSCQAMEFWDNCPNHGLVWNQLLPNFHGERMYDPRKQKPSRDDVVLG